MTFPMPPLPEAAQLLPGQILYAGQGILDPSGRFLLAMQMDGNLVLYDMGNGNVAYWASNTSSSGANGVAMQGDGNLVVLAGGVPRWSASAGNHIPGSHATLQSDGNLVLYLDANEIPSHAVWSSATSTSPGFLSSIENSLSSAADDFVNTVHEIPGVDWAGQQLRDFANTSVGQWFLRIVASSVTGALVPFVGPQVASVAFAIPGLAAGGTFAAAWSQETLWRVEQTAQILAGSAASALSAELLAQWQPYLDQLKGLADQLKSVTYSMIADVGGDPNGIPGLVTSYVSHYGDQALAQLANRYLARQDVTQMIIDGATHASSFARPATPAFFAPAPFDHVQIRAQPARAGKSFDPVTGVQIVDRPFINPRIIPGLVTVQQQKPSSPAATAAKGAAVVGGAALIGSAIAAHLQGIAFGALWSRLWDETGAKALKSLRRRL